MMHQLYPQVFHDYCYELNKDMHIAAAHFIPHQLAGKCAHIHGHTYVVNITVAGDALDETGFLVNFQKLKQLVHGKLDHTLLMIIKIGSILKIVNISQRQKLSHEKYTKWYKIIWMHCLTSQNVCKYLCVRLRQAMLCTARKRVTDSGKDDSRT